MINSAAMSERQENAQACFMPATYPGSDAEKMKCR